MFLLFLCLTAQTRMEMPKMVADNWSVECGTIQGTIVL